MVQDMLINYEKYYFVVIFVMWFFDLLMIENNKTRLLWESLVVA